MATAEEAGLASASIDLVTLATALHWLDYEVFYGEVRRILKPDGVVAAWCYPLLEIEPAVDRIVKPFAHELLGPFWPPERRHVRDRYRSLPFPFAEIQPPAFSMEQRWRLQELTGYLATWSASSRYQDQIGRDPVELIRADLATAWGPPEAAKKVRWPLYLRVGLNRA